MPLSEPGLSAVDFNGPDVVTPAPTDRFVVRQADGVVRVETRLQIHTLEANERILLDNGSNALPGLSWVQNPDSGIRMDAGAEMSFVINGSPQAICNSNGLAALNATGGQMINEAASGTNPTMLVNRNDGNSGHGQGALDEVATIAGGVQVANFTEAAGVVQVALPLQNDAANPSLAFGVLADDGFFESAAAILQTTLSGIQRWTFQVGSFGTFNTARPALLNETPSDTNPNIIPVQTDAGTGVGWRVANVGVLVGGSQNCMEFGGVGAVPQVGFYGTAAINLQTGVAVTAAGIHAALVNLGLITA